MAKRRRKDKSRVVLRIGELQRKDGTYQYSRTDERLMAIYFMERSEKRIKNNTFENYPYMYETFARQQIGSRQISMLKMILSGTIHHYTFLMRP